MRARCLLPTLFPVVMLCACDRTAPAPESIAPAAPTTVATPAAASSTPANAADARAATRYACDAGTSVAILADGKARVDLPDGTDVQLQRIADSSPPVYTGSGLYLTLGDEAAHLSQDDGRELACRLLK